MASILSRLNVLITQAVVYLSWVGLFCEIYLRAISQILKLLDP